MTSLSIGSYFEHLSYLRLEILHERSGAIVVAEGHGELHLKTFLKDLEEDLEHLSRGYLGLEILLERSGAMVVEGHGELKLETFLKNIEIPINKLEPFVSYRYLLLLFIPGQCLLIRVCDAVHLLSPAAHQCSRCLM